MIVKTYTIFLYFTLLIINNITIAATAQYGHTSSINVFVVNDSAANGGDGGVLGLGWFATYDKTKCVADGPTECAAAAAVQVPAFAQSPRFTFTADPSLNILNASLVYPIINDEGLPSGTYNIVIKLQNGANIIDRCQAEIVPPMQGSVQYVATVIPEGSEADNTCKIQVVRNGPPSPNGFIFMQNLPTYTHQWEAFTINDENYLLSTLAALEDSASPSGLKNMFKFDANEFLFKDFDRVIPGECRDPRTQEWLLMDRVYAWKHLNIEGKDAIVMANHNSSGKNARFECIENSYWTKSYVFWWEDNQFDYACNEECMYILTDSPLMLESYTIGENTYLAVAEQNVAEQSQSAIYQWVNNHFEKMSQPNLQIKNAFHVATFKDQDNQTYLIFTPIGHNADLQVYQVDSKGQLHLYQNSAITPQFPIAPEGFAQSAFVFQHSDNHGHLQTYLLVGYSAGGANTADPWIYRWEFDARAQRALFKRYQPLDDLFKQAGNFAHYQVNNKDFIGVTMGRLGAYSFEWNNALSQLDLTYDHIIYNPNDGTYIKAITPFWVTDNSGKQHLLVAVAISGTTTYESPLLRWAPLDIQKNESAMLLNDNIPKN